jgi:hypothetical protein
VKVTKVKPLGGYRLRFHFSDGTAGERDLSDLLKQSGPMVEPLKDPSYFRRVFIELGAPTWPNGFDLAPWALHREMSVAGLLHHPQTA